MIKFIDGIGLFWKPKLRALYTEAVDGHVRVLVGVDEKHAEYVLLLTPEQARAVARVLVEKADELRPMLRLVKGKST